jgi:quinol monooxygenase YgiN
MQAANSMFQIKSMLVLGASILTAMMTATGYAQDVDKRYVQVAEIQIDPAQLEAYRAAVREQIEAALSKEPGVLTLNAVSDANDPTHVTVFEIYADLTAYKAHLETEHFKKYKTVTAQMVKSLRLVRVSPIMLGMKDAAK